MARRKSQACRGSEGRPVAQQRNRRAARFFDTLELQAKTLTGKPVSRDVLKDAIPQRFLVEE